MNNTSWVLVLWMAVNQTTNIIATVIKELHLYTSFPLQLYLCSSFDIILYVLSRIHWFCVQLHIWSIISPPLSSASCQSLRRAGAGTDSLLLPLIPPGPLVPALSLLLWQISSAPHQTHFNCPIAAGSLSLSLDQCLHWRVCQVRNWKNTCDVRRKKEASSWHTAVQGVWLLRAGKLKRVTLKSVFSGFSLLTAKWICLVYGQINFFFLDWYKRTNDLQLPELL